MTGLVAEYPSEAEEYMTPMGRIALVIAACIVLGASPVRAHHDLSHTAGQAVAVPGNSLADGVGNLFGSATTNDVRALGCCGPTGHGFHFSAGARAANQVLLDTLRSTLTSAIVNFPTPSPASGFTFKLDPATGVFERSTQSFGPIFADRAETVGKGKFSLGVTYSRLTFDEVDGRDLENGDVRFVFLHEPTAQLNAQDPQGRGVNCNAPPFPCGAPFAFENDTVTTQLFMDLTVDQIILSATYGILDNLDVGVALPILRVDIDARAVSTSNNESRTPLVPPPGGLAHNLITQESRFSDDSTGIGDLLLRAKYNFFRDPMFAMAGILELRLPTGDEDNFRGLDTVRVRPFFVASAGFGGFAPHVNLGFDLGDTDKAKNEFIYRVGFDWGVISWATLAADVLGRYIIDSDRVELGSDQAICVGGSNPSDPACPGGVRNVSRSKADSHIVDAAFGVKFNPWKNVLLIANVLIPLNDTGLRDDVTPLVGIEVGF